MSSDTAPLVLRNVTKTYGSHPAIRGLSLQLNPAEVFGFLGPNGAGKSTTIRTILNFLAPSQGTIEVFGLNSVSSSAAIKRRVGYLAGDIALYERLTGRQLLRYLSALRPGTDWAYVRELADRLEAPLDRPVSTLSKGNKQKIGLIQAFMHRPDLLILDEPTSGLDPLMKQTFYDMVAEERERGTTVFVSSHDLTEVQKICQRAAFIRDGTLVAIEDFTRSRALQLRQYVAAFRRMPAAKELAALPGVDAFTIDGSRVNLTVTGDIKTFLAALVRYDLGDLESQETTLEDVFMHYYQAAPEAAHA